MKVAGREYEVGLMTPREQFHVMRRLAPLLGTSGEAIFALLDKERDKAEVMKTMAMTIGPLAEALAYMPDEMINYILDTCLCHVKQQNPDHGTWHPIYVRSPGSTMAMRMMQDVDALTELKLCSEVIKVNLSGFFAQLSGASASPLSAANQAQASNT